MYGKNHKFNSEEFNKNRKTISPITFINGEIKADEDLNNLFTLPYDLALISRATVNTMAMQVKPNCDPDTFENFEYDCKRQTLTNHVDAIYAYLLMNTRDFSYNFLQTMFNSIMRDIIPAIPKKYNYSDNEDEEYNYRYKRNYFNYCTSSQQLDKIIKDTLDGFTFGLCTVKDLPPIYYYQLMNNMYTQLIIYIDGIIRDMVYTTFQQNKYFDDLMRHVYGENNGIKASQFTTEFKYVFATSIIREKVEQKLPEFYQGLHYIFQNAAAMSYTGANPIHKQDIKSLNTIPIGVIGKGGSVIEPGDCDCNESCEEKCHCNHEKLSIK